MIYNIKDKIPFGKLLLFSVQMLLSVFVATALIATICQVDVGAALIGAGLATIVYSLITKYESPMFISNSGAFVSPVLIALGLCGYTGVMVGGITTAIVYSLFGVIFTKIPVDKIYKVFPKALIGAVTVVIGVNLMGFIPTYLGETGGWGIFVSLFTLCVIALLSNYAKGILKILPFLIGILSGYLLAVILTLTGVCQLIDLSVFSKVKIINVPNFAFLNFNSINFSNIVSIVILYSAFTISAMMECLSDHAALGNIIDRDLYKEPGLGRIFIGEGVANLFSSFFGGLGACSYGEGVACVGFSQVASAKVTVTSAIMLILLGFLGPIQAFISSIPSCVFAGAAIVLYGFISCSGIKMLQNVNLNNQKNLIITSTVMSVGICGLIVGNSTISFTGTALALIVGIILNIFLKDKENC